MQQKESKLAPYETRLVDLWDKMVRTIGIHTTNVLVERAIWEASLNYPELELIKHNDQGFSLEALEKSYADRPEKEVADAFGALTSELLLIMARLLGKEMAQKVAEELETKMAREKRPGQRKESRK